MISRHSIAAEVPLDAPIVGPVEEVYATSFEDGPSIEWYDLATDDDAVPVSGDAHTGSYALPVVATLDAGGFHLGKVDGLLAEGVPIGTEYTVTLWIKVTAGTPDVFVGTGDTPEYEPRSLDPGWNQITLTETMTEVGDGVVFLEVGLLGNQNDAVLIDDVSLSCALEYDAVPLSVIDAEITLDEGWSPYAQARLRCWTPPEALLDEIDPREGVRVNLTLTQDWGDPGIGLGRGENLVPNGTFDTDLTGWTAGAETSIARVTFPVDVGAGAISLQKTVTSSTSASVRTPSGTSGIPVEEGESYELTASVRAGSVVRSASLSIFWYTAAGTFITGTGSFHDDYSTETYTQISLVATAPATAAFAQVGLSIEGAAIGELHYFDTILFRRIFDEPIPYGTIYHEPVTRTFDLALRAREIDHETGTMALDLASDEALLQDYARVATTPADPASTNVRTIVGWALGNIGASLEAGTQTGIVEAEATLWEPGVSAWDYLQPLVNKAGLRLWCDEQRRWWLTDPLSGTEGGLVLSGGVSVTYASDLIDREREWFDAVVITYKWRDDLGVDHVEHDTAYLPGWSKVLHITYDRPWPGNGAAAAILARSKGRGRRVAIEAMNDYEATPGQAVSITLPNTPLQTGMVSAVTWRLPDDEMRVTTRDLIDTPPHSWVATVGGVAWEDIPVGIDWTEYEYTE